MVLYIRDAFIKKLEAENGPRKRNRGGTAQAENMKPS